MMGFHNMRTYLVFGAFFLMSGQCLADYYQQSSNYFCTNLNPQHMVDMSQLEGIWYVMEKIIHTEERHYTVNVTTCPIIHISEDRSQTTTYNPVIKTYETTYGSAYPHDTNPTDPRTSFSSEQDYLKRSEEYDRHTTYDYKRRKMSHAAYIKHLYAIKHLRIYWDDDNYSTEYHLRYNISQPGFWISSGPEGASDLPENRKHFAGTVQVIKAVGHHVVLTFCHPLPNNKQLFTVIISRESHLDERDISSVHGLLNRKGLSTNAVEKSCNKASEDRLSLASSFFAVSFYLIYYFK